MATRPINRYTAQEARNLRVYENYSSSIITLTDADADADFIGKTGAVSITGNGSIATVSCPNHGLDSSPLTVTISGTTTFDGSYSVLGQTTHTFIFAHASTGSGELGTFTAAANVEEGVNWIPIGYGPAKKVMIFPLLGAAADNITLYLKINGTYGDAISLEANDYPIIIDKLLIDQIRLSSGDDTDGTDTFSIIAFH